MIGLIVAMDVEMQTILSEMEIEKKIKKEDKIFYVGKVKNTAIVLCKSQVGKVNASIATTQMIELFDIEYIINFGVAGGLGNKVNSLDILLATELIYHDVDASDLGYELGQIPGMPKTFKTDQGLLNRFKEVSLKNDITYKTGIVATGDIFATKDNFFGSFDAVDMESTAIAHVCYLYNKPLLVIKIISDIIGSENQVNDFSLLEAKASEIVSKCVSSFL